MSDEPSKGDILAALAALQAEGAGVAESGRAGMKGKRGRPRPVTTPSDRVRDIVADAPAVPPSPSEARAAETPAGDGDDAPWAGAEHDAGAPAPGRRGPAAAADPAIVARCAGFPQSDTGNGARLRAHFGPDLAVLETENVASSDYYVWTGTHWDTASGNDAAKRVAQDLGPRIVMEAEHLAYGRPERELLARAEAILKCSKATWTDEDREAVEAAAKLPGALAARRKSRRDFGVTSGNVGRLRAMLDCAAPFLTRKPDAFNTDPMLVAVAGHTLRFSREVRRVRELDPECPDPDVERFIERDEVVARVEALPGHRRADLITKVMPVAYDPAAACPRWDAFLAEFLPDPAVRRMVQVFSGLGMTGIMLQRLLFHYGLGANGKSVLMETLMQVMGPLGVDLPAASLVGDSKNSGDKATPDIAMLYGARCVRVSELPADEPLKEALVKQLTGGERMAVRNLFKGFFRFQPVFKAHLSGNGYPRIDGTDHGIWRRMVLVPWTVTIAEARQRVMSDVVAEFMAESSGILNWLIEGVLIFLREGFVVPEAASQATREYREEMDPIGQFLTVCVERCPGQKVQANVMYAAYESWCLANAKTLQSRNKFSKVAVGLFKKEKSSLNYWLDCRLHDVPLPPVGPAGHAEER